MKPVLKKILKTFAIYVCIPLLILKFLVVFLGVVLFIIFCFDSNSGKPVYSREKAASPIYRSGEDFYKLTGVRFPEISMVDSVYFEDGGFPTCAWWNEYKYVPDEDFKDDFFKTLEKACKEDSTHWSITESGYRYYILPDRDTVDRTQGMSDRMVKMEDGNVVPDWDGSFISVNVENDMISLRQGWLR